MDFRTRFLAYYRYLKTTDRKWYRHSIAVLLIIGGLLGFLPVLGFWMLPLGLARDSAATRLSWAAAARQKVKNLIGSVCAKSRQDHGGQKMAKHMDES